MSTATSTLAEKIHVPSDFFSHALKEYKDWQLAWFRETLQNSLDAGAIQVDFSIKKVDDRIQLSCTDNGHGIPLKTIKKGLLTLGGSVKSNHDKTIGGFGYAKHIILFAHYHYQIQTQDLLVTGSGTHYQIKDNQDFIKGTSITVLLKDKVSIKYLKYCCKTLAKNHSGNAHITLNNKQIRPYSDKHDYEIMTVLGDLKFSEVDDSGVEIWIRMKGLPMFQYYLEASGQIKGVIATLDLKGNPTELLTSNRDGLTSDASSQLDHLLYALTHQRQQFKRRNSLSLVFNSDTEHINQENRNPKSHVTDSKQSLQSPQTHITQRLQQIIFQLSNLPLIPTYPENFHLHVNNMLFDKQRISPDQITLSQIKYSLNLKRTQLLAWCWHYAVYWVLETEFLNSCLVLEFDETSNGYTSKVDPKQVVKIETGFVFDTSSEGINFQEHNTIKILLNPLFFQSDWLIGDLIDTAVHECTHCLEMSHGEIFNEYEVTIRRDFRRLIDEQEIVYDALKIIDDLSSLI